MSANIAALLYLIAGVLFILALFVLVMIAQWLGKRFGVKE